MRSKSVVCLLALLALAGCRKEDDRTEIVPARHWVEKTVAVVAPLGDAGTKTRLERTAAWFLENFREAQRYDTLAIDLHIEWHDELGEELAPLSTALASREDIVAVIGPFDNEQVAAFAPACMKTRKPLIVPTATSEDIIRRYAITTSGFHPNDKPFLWSLTETDVAFTSLLMSSYATITSYYGDYMTPKAALFAPDDSYGKTFNYWAPFYAQEDNIQLRGNELYSSDEDLVRRVEAYRAGFTEAGSWSSAIFCVAERAEQVLALAKANRRAVVTDPDLSSIFPSTDPEDPANDAFWDIFRTSFHPYFAYAHLSEESLAALGPRAAAFLQGYEGFSPYADPTTGFELSYSGKFGVFPTFAECKFYDALMLAAFATCYMAHQKTADNLNDAIIAITMGTDKAPLKGPAWDVTAMQLYLKFLEQGQLLHFDGASGAIGFDKETYTAATATTYVHWQILDGTIRHRSYFSKTGSARTASAQAAWLYIYNEQRALEDFRRQAGEDSGSSISYPALTDQYAVLVQGSEGFVNYRHQADVLNVYQLLRRGGVPDDHIILVLDKKLATDSRNPEPGVIRTAPSGPDLLGGTSNGIPAAEVDYDSADLTADDVADILSGRSSGHLPVVLPQGKGNNVFFYWSGHGRNVSHGGFREFGWRDAGPGKGFSAALLEQTARQMQYRKLLVVAEPCYAECVTRDLEGIPGALAISGANSEEQSWADSWSNEANVWMCDRFTQNFVNCLTAHPDTNFQDLFLYCAQHTLGSHARIVNAAGYGNLYVTGPAEFVQYNRNQ